MRNGLGGIDTVLLVGGTSEIGLAIVRRLEPRRSVILMGRSREAMATAARSLDLAPGVEVEIVEWDAAMTDEDGSLFEAAFRQRDVDVAIIAAGVLGDNAAQLDDPSQGIAMARVTYLGAASALLEAARGMRRQGHGDIVVLSSFAAVRPRPGNFIYGSAKSGLDYLARGLADTLTGSGVSVMTVRPGFVHTRMTAGLTAAPLSTDPATVADVVVRSRYRGSGVVYAPKALAVMALAVRAMPRALLARLDKR